MKKLLTVLCTVAFVACAQAISLKWNATGDTAWAKNVDSFAIVATSVASPDIATVINIAKSATTDSQYEKLAISTNQEDLNANFVQLDADRSKFAGMVQIGTVESVDSDNFADSYFIVAFDVAKEKYAYTMFDRESGWFASGDTPKAPIDVTFTGTMTVPEPTALALLALGIAGLALRRRAA